MTRSPARRRQLRLRRREIRQVPGVRLRLLGLGPCRQVCGCRTSPSSTCPRPAWNRSARCGRSRRRRARLPCLRRSSRRFARWWSESVRQALTNSIAERGLTSRAARRSNTWLSVRDRRMCSPGAGSTGGSAPCASYNAAQCSTSALRRSPSDPTDSWWTALFGRFWALYASR